jgi:proteasome lid subunit RPN8/RPN11
MSVHRRTLLPTGPAVGDLLVPEAVLSTTRAALQASSGNGRRHEGLVLWLGRVVDDDTLVMSCTAPVTWSRPGGVHIDEAAVGTAARTARRYGLGVVAQVHSHPGLDTRHSDGDDELVLMPYHGMFSLVVAEYGHGSLEPRRGAGLHQFQTDRWVAVPSESFIIVPPIVGPRDHPMPSRE